MTFNAEFFVFLGFILFVLLIAYSGAHKKIVAGLDARTQRIAAELAEAKRLREEAAAVLAGFEKKRAAAVAGSGAIVAHANAEADMNAQEKADPMAGVNPARSQPAQDQIAPAGTQ